MKSVIRWRRAAELRRAFFERHSSNDLSSPCGLQCRRTLPLRCLFQIRPARVHWCKAVRITGSGSLLSHWWTGIVLGLLTGLVKVGEGYRRGLSNHPMPSQHPPPCRLVISCSRRMIICMTELDAFATGDYDSPWQWAFFSSLSCAPDNFMTGCPAQLQERICGLCFINNHSVKPLHGTDVMWKENDHDKTASRRYGCDLKLMLLCLFFFFFFPTVVLLTRWIKQTKGCGVVIWGLSWYKLLQTWALWKGVWHLGSMKFQCNDSFTASGIACDKYNKVSIFQGELVKMISVLIFYSDFMIKHQKYIKK